MQAFPYLPDTHALAVLLLTIIAFYLFSRDKVPIETTSLIVLVALTVGFQLFPYEAAGKTVAATDFFLGFGHQALVAICALMILGQGLVKTGALEPFSRWFSRYFKTSPMVSMALLLVFCAAASGVVNDTPLVVLMMPLLVSVALRTGTAPSYSLLSMNYAVLLGGMCTAIGTSTNLLVLAIAADMGVRRFGIFDFTPMAAIATAVGLLYVWLLVPRLIPKRKAPMADTAQRVFSAVLYLADDGFAAGKTLAEAMARSDNRLRLDRIERGDTAIQATLADFKLQAGDRLHVFDTPENLKEFETLLGATLHADAALQNGKAVQTTQHLVEVVVTAGSLLDRRTLNQVRFAEICNAIVLAVHRGERQLPLMASDVAREVLKVGDVLLMQGSEADISALRQRTSLMVLTDTQALPATHKAPLVLAVLALVVLAAAFKLMPISISASLGVLVLLLTRCIDWDDTGRSLSTRVIMLVVSSLALGVALTRTGGTEYIARLLLFIAQDLPAQGLLALLMLVMAVLTNFVSNNAAAAIGTPIAVSMAQLTGAAAEPFVLAILFGANFCFATPMGYQTNLMVMSAGGYKFSDFVRAGVPLTILMLVLYTLLLPYFFPP